MPIRLAFRRFWPAMRGEGRSFAIAGALLTVAAVCEIVAVFVLADVIDGALSAGSAADFTRLAVLWLLITAVSTGADYGGQVLSAGVSERVVLRLRDQLFAHVQRLHPVDHRRVGLGNLVARHSGDLEAVEYLIGSGVMQLVIALGNTIGLVTAAFVMSWQVALVAIAAVPVLWVVSAVFSRRQLTVTRDERGANADISDAVASALAGHETAVAYNQQGREHRRLHGHGVTWLGARMAQTRVEAGFGAVMGFGQVVVTLAIAVTGAWQVRQGELTVGQLLSLTGYLGLLYPKMQEIADVRLAIASAVVSAERVIEVLDMRPAEHDDPKAARCDGDHDSHRRSPSDAGSAAIGVSMRGVSLHRDGRAVLEYVDLSIAPGEIVALTGPSGVGKSTLAALLCRFEHPDGGRLLLGDADYSMLTGYHVRENVTLLPQQPIIIAATVAENIAYGRPSASRADIIAAAIAADADTFIRDLPDGYDTPLTDAGLTLSGGQRQRIAFARAMIRDTPVLILDEPTVGLDDATVGRITSPLRRLARGRSTLLITHDRRITEVADRVVELRDGRIYEMSAATLPDLHNNFVA